MESDEMVTLFCVDDGTLWQCRARATPKTYALDRNTIALVASVEPNQQRTTWTAFRMRRTVQKDVIDQFGFALTAREALTQAVAKAEVDLHNAQLRLSREHARLAQVGLLREYYEVSSK